MIANIASSLILGSLRFALDARWGIETFGQLSLALSMVNLFLSFVTQVSMVFFPALRQCDSEEIQSFYRNSCDLIGIMFPAVYIAFFPIVVILGQWLPEFASSFKFFAWLIPICVFDARMNITCTTLFKVRREEGLLLRINVVTTVVSSALVLVSVLLFSSIELAIGVTTGAIIGRSIYSESIMASKMQIDKDLILYEDLALTVLFILASLLLNGALAFASYLTVYVAFLFINRTRLREVLRALG